MNREPVTLSAPELRVPQWIDAQGNQTQPLKLADIGAGFKVIFCFQYACPGCHSHGFPTLQKLVETLSGQGFGFAAVQTAFEAREVNTFDRLRETQLRYGLQIPFGHDPALERLPSLMADYQTMGTPWFLVLDPLGEVLHSDFRLDAERLLRTFGRTDEVSLLPASAAAQGSGAQAGAQATALTMVLDNSYARELEGLYVPWKPAGSPAPRLVQLNRALAVELGLDADALAAPAGLAVLAGNALPPQAQPLAQAYAGHQFGGFSPQLGDGRALLLGEIVDRQGQRRDIAFKGSGRTPFSRGGDGKAALGPVLREYIMGEAMHALGIPTTRALAAVSTGAQVMREQAQPGAILTRVAASHLRVGTFEFAATHGDEALLRRLADYAIARHDPSLADTEEPYLELLQAVAERQAALVARWMGVGFIHGVMNTDNMTISGETIDYGPCAFLEHFDPKAVFSSIDTGGRYAYGNQPAIAQWNLARFAEALLPLIDTDPEAAAQRASGIIAAFSDRFDGHWTAVLRAKLGLDTAVAGDRVLADDYLALLHQHRIDFTLAFARLTDAAAGDDAPLRALWGAQERALLPWLQRWQQRFAASPTALPQRLAAMRRANPVYIPRNHLVEAALQAAVERDDLQPLENLLQVLQQPFEERPQDAAYAQPAPAAQTACYRTFCGT